MLTLPPSLRARVLQNKLVAPLESKAPTYHAPNASQVIFTDLP